MPNLQFANMNYGYAQPYNEAYGSLSQNYGQQQNPMNMSLTGSIPRNVTGNTTPIEQEQYDKPMDDVQQEQYDKPMDVVTGGGYPTEPKDDINLDIYDQSGDGDIPVEPEEEPYVKPWAISENMNAIIAQREQDSLIPSGMSRRELFKIGRMPTAKQPQWYRDYKAGKTKSSI